MAVEVVTGYGHGGHEEKEKFAEGATIEVQDGHLAVRADAGDSMRGHTLAWFAPGQWKFARTSSREK